MSGQIITAIVTLLGGGLGGAILSSMTGKAKEKRQEERTAWIERDLEASNRRIMEEYAHALRRILLRLGFIEDDGTGAEKIFPRWPRLRTAKGENSES